MCEIYAKSSRENTKSSDDNFLPEAFDPFSWNDPKNDSFSDKMIINEKNKEYCNILFLKFYHRSYRFIQP